MRWIFAGVRAWLRFHPSTLRIAFRKTKLILWPEFFPGRVHSAQPVLQSVTPVSRGRLVRFSSISFRAPRDFKDGKVIPLFCGGNVGLSARGGVRGPAGPTDDGVQITVIGEECETEYRDRVLIQSSMAKIMRLIFMAEVAPEDKINRLGCNCIQMGRICV